MGITSVWDFNFSLTVSREIQSHRAVLRSLGYQVAETSYAFPDDEVTEAEKFYDQHGQSGKTKLSSATTAGMLSSPLAARVHIDSMQLLARSRALLPRKSASTKPATSRNLPIHRLREAVAAISCRRRFQDQSKPSARPALMPIHLCNIRLLEHRCAVKVLFSNHHLRSYRSDDHHLIIR